MREGKKKQIPSVLACRPCGTLWHNKLLAKLYKFSKYRY